MGSTRSWFFLTILAVFTSFDDLFAIVMRHTSNVIELVVYKPLFIRWFQNIEAARQKEAGPETPLPVENQNPTIDPKKVVIDGCKVVVHIQGSQQRKTFIIDTEKYPAQKAFLGKAVGSSVVLQAYGNEGLFIIDEIIQ
ncbi:MAG: hypothetical protein IIY28_11255 [Lachnospiraceae bacterium]|nr:hypothetical protein [Lachnospiraceae bacterium]